MYKMKHGNHCLYTRWFKTEKVNQGAMEGGDSSLHPDPFI